MFAQREPRELRSFPAHVSVHAMGGNKENGSLLHALQTEFLFSAHCLHARGGRACRASARAVVLVSSASNVSARSISSANLSWPPHDTVLTLNIEAVAHNCWVLEAYLLGV